MKFNVFPVICKKLVDEGSMSYDQIQGCSSEEIENLELYLKESLPNIYKQFLIYMGHGAGDFFQGTEIFYNSVFESKEVAKELLDEVGNCFELTAKEFVFASHQGYQFWYFRMDEGDDPAVYHYMEGEKLPVKKWESFSDFLIDNVKDYIHFHKQ